MTRHAIGAALYAPCGVLIYEEEPGRASSTTAFVPVRPVQGQRVDRVAVSLDRKLADLGAEATR